jgi:hypothetical protein
VADQAKRGVAVNDLATLATSILSRSKLAARSGTQFGGRRDLYEVLGYDRVLTYDDYYARYRRQHIARRIVTAKPAATWRHAPVVLEDKDRGSDTSFEGAWRDLDQRVGVTMALRQADQLAGIGRYGILLIGIRGGGGLERPLHPDSRRGTKSVLYLRAFPEGFADIKVIDGEPSSSRFGLPMVYELDLGTNGLPLSRPIAQVRHRVHWSRVIHIAEEPESDDVLGTPRLEVVDTLLADLAKTIGASAEMFWVGADRGMQFDVKSDDYELSQDDENLLTRELDEFYHGLRRYIRTTGVDVKQLGGTPADPRGVFEPILDLIAGAVSIPKRILLGSERGELASSQDQSSWVEHIQERQVTFAEPRILRPLIDRLVWLGALPAPADGYQVEWPTLFAKSDGEKADEAFRVAGALERYARASGRPVGDLMTPDEFRERILGLPPRS